MERQIVTAQNLSFYQSNTSIIENITFDIKYGELLVIAGPNGAGKTTLLHLIIGTLHATSGSIKINTSNIAYMPQKFTIPSQIPFRVSDFFNLYKNHDISNHPLILDIKDKNVHTLSGGEKRRMLLAATIAKNADLIIIDEPEQNLDQQTISAMHNTIEEQISIGKSIIIASHEHKMIFSQNRKIMYLDKSLIYIGPSDSSILSSLHYQHQGDMCHFISQND